MGVKQCLYFSMGWLITFTCTSKKQLVAFEKVMWSIRNKSES